MDFWLLIREGLRDIFAHKFRSFLTSLGIILGVASLISMFAITEGMALNMRESLTASGDMEKIQIRNAEPPPEQEAIEDLSPGQTYADAIALRNASPLISWVSPYTEQWVKALHGGFHDQTRLKGVEKEYLLMDKLEVQHGRFITDLDLMLKNRVCILGYRPLLELFDGDPKKAMGEVVTMNGVNFRIVGVMPQYLNTSAKLAKKRGITEKQKERRAQRGGRKHSWDPLWWKNDQIIVPLTTYQSIFKQVTMVDGEDLGPDLKLSGIQVGMIDPIYLKSIEEQIQNTLLMTHRGILDFELVTAEEKIEKVNKQIWGIRVQSGVIAGIALIVGGFGITNIMLASIVDRVHEIGLRRAVGATASDIFLQVLVESSLLAVLGGIAGIFTGNLMIYVLETSFNMPFVLILKPEAVVISFSFAVGTGLMAGIYPAWKAASLSPLQALKFD